MFDCKSPSEDSVELGKLFCESFECGLKRADRIMNQIDSLGLGLGAIKKPVIYVLHSAKDRHHAIYAKSYRIRNKCKKKILSVLR